MFLVSFPQRLSVPCGRLRRLLLAFVKIDRHNRTTSVWHITNNKSNCLIIDFNITKQHCILTKNAKLSMKISTIHKKINWPIFRRHCSEWKQSRGPDYQRMLLQALHTQTVKYNITYSTQYELWESWRQNRKHTLSSVGKSQWISQWMLNSMLKLSKV